MQCDAFGPCRIHLYIDAPIEVCAGEGGGISKLDNCSNNKQAVEG